jgi:UDP-N-acetylglucosamine--N-acetylmuramyl-(pentapeptide) pyrophosphoryl-undecaprenol N-acetylglucosamine transferase
MSAVVPTASAPTLIAAGGTGGHMFPALALARSLLERGERVAVVTDDRGARYLPEGIERFVIKAGSPSGNAATRLRGLLALARGTLQSIAICRRLQPRAAACFGGYACVPVGLAAWLAGKPLLLHEQNAVFGRANRLLARLARTIALSFDATRSAPADARIVVTGNPVRPGFGVDETAFRAPSAESPFRLLVIGGSQGARIFSDVVPAAVGLLPPELRRRLRIQQQCRPEDLSRVHDRYARDGLEAEVTAFFTDMPTQMREAHLIISRAGASSLTEIIAMGRPSILVPYAAAADDHQRANAEALASAGGCLRILQPDCDAATMAGAIAALMTAPDRLEAMASTARASYRSDAAARLADAVLALTAVPPPAVASNGAVETEVAQ